MMPKPKAKATQPTPMEIAAAQTAARLQGVMPYLQDEIGKMEAQVKMRAFNAIRDGKLTPDLAISLWMEAHAVQMLHVRLRTKSIIGAQTADALTGTEPTT